MKTAISTGCLLACALSLDAQITTTLKHLPDGLDEVRIHNNSAAAVVAFIVAVPEPLSGIANAPRMVFQDPLIEPPIQPLAPGEERVLIRMIGPVSGPDNTHKNPFEEPVIAAGILADGTTTGDAALLARLITRRCNMLQAVEMALQTLTEAGKHNVPRSQLIDQFEQLAQGVNHWYLPPEQAVGRALFQSIAGQLINLPKGEAGSPFPPENYVEQEATTLNRQRVTLLESQPDLAEALRIR